MCEGEIEIPVNSVINRGVLRESRPVMKRSGHNFHVGHGRITLEFEYGTRTATTGNSTKITKSDLLVITQQLPYAATTATSLTYGYPYQQPQQQQYPTYSAYPGQTSYTAPTYPYSAPVSYTAPPVAQQSYAPSVYNPPQSPYPAPYAPPAYDTAPPLYSQQYPNAYPPQPAPTYPPQQYPSPYPPQY
jgi:hypothetical protein